MTFEASIRARAVAVAGRTMPQGDGASVPYQLAPWPGNLLLRAFKEYLDFRFAEAFQLHDFLYSDAAAPTGVSRREADLALFLDLQADPGSAATVYGAVALFGAPDFRPGIGQITMPPMWARDP